MSKEPDELPRGPATQPYAFNKKLFGEVSTADVEGMLPTLAADNSPIQAVKGASWMAAMHRNRDIKENIAFGVSLAPGSDKVSKASCKTY